MSAEEDAYKRGMLDATVAEHTRHLNRINGSLEKVVDRLSMIAAAQLRAAELATTRNTVEVTRAQTVKDTRQEAIDKTEANWKPWQKISVIVITLAAITGVVINYIRAH